MPQNDRQAKKARISAFYTRFKAKFRRHRPETPAVATRVFTPETTNDTNHGNQNGISLVSDTKETPVPDTKETLVPDTKGMLEPDAKETLEPDTKETLVPDTKEMLEPDAKETLEPDTKETLVPDTKEILVDQNSLASKVPGVTMQISKAAPLINEDWKEGAKVQTRNLWNEAFLSLKSHEQNQLTKILGDGQQSSVFTKPDFASLKAEVQLKRDQCEKESWRISVGGNDLIVRDFAAKSATWLQKLGDAIIPFAPTAVSAPWGLIKGILQISVTYDQQMLVLLLNMDEVLRVVYYGQIYESLYTVKTTDNDILQALQVELHGIYQSALELIVHTHNQLSGGTGKNVVEAIFNPNSADDFLGRLKARHISLSHAAQLCEIHRCAKADNRLWKEAVNLNEHIADLRKKIDTYFQKIENVEMTNILDAISSIPYTTHHQGYQEKRTTNTCNWLLEDERFRAWESSTSSGVFWLWGTAGVGKSFLTSKVIDHLKQKMNETPNHERLAFFYCRRARGEELRSKPLSVLQSFLGQLAYHFNKLELMKSGLVEVFRKIQEEKGSFNRSICESLLLDSFDLFPCTTLVIDALDECDPASRGELIEFLNIAMNRASAPVKIFIASRPDDDIKRAFVSKQNAGVHAGMSQGDMRLFIDHRLQSMMKNNPAIEKLKEEISEQLFAKCDGMFQWTHLQLEHLRTSRTEHSIKARLKSLPSGLKEAYDEIYDRIKQQDDLAPTLVNRAIMWVMCAAKPLTSDEILSAIRIDANEESFQVSEKISQEDLLFFCQHLLVIDHMGLWKVSHLSVMEYFEQQHHCTLPDAHLYVGNACLLFLLDMPDWNEDLESGGKTEISEDTAKTKPRAPSLHAGFQQYVLYHWPIHAQAQNGRSVSQIISMKMLLVKFLGSPTRSSVWYKSWFQRAKYWFQSFRKERTSRTSLFYVIGDLKILSPSDFSMLLVCRLGIYTALGDWWDDLDDCLEQVNSLGVGLVELATDAESYPICKRLLDAGASVDKDDPGSSLYKAIYSRNLELIQLIHEKNQLPWDWLIQHVTFQGALFEALESGEYEIGRYISSDSRLDLNMDFVEFGRPIDAIIDNHDPKLVEFLIDRGAHINVAYEYDAYGYGCLLAKVTRQKSLSMVKSLVSKGANVNLLLKCGDYGSALAAAISNDTEDCLDIVKYLVECGADINLPLEHGNYGSALAAATSNNTNDCLDIVKYLVECGADINLPLEYGNDGSALAAATSNNTEDCLGIVKYLVECGADINLPLKYGNYGSALAAAAATSYTKYRLNVVKYLVECGADINLPLEHGNYGSALAAAAATAHTDHTKDNLNVVKYLVKCGADVNLPLKYGNYGSALAAATTPCIEDNLNVVKYLVECSADINLPLKCGYYGSALAAAAVAAPPLYPKNILGIVKYLVECGADINLPLEYGHYGSALAAAADGPEENLNVIKYLVEHGAIINLPLEYGYFGSAFAAAAATANVSMFYAFGDRGLDIIKYFIECGADINLPLKYGDYGSVLAAAVLSLEPFPKFDLVKHLVNCGAKVNLKLKCGIYGSALAAAAIIPPEYLDIVRYLVDCGADINLLLEHGEFGSALTAGAYFGNMEYVKLLISKGASINLKVNRDRFSNALEAAEVEISKEHLIKFSIKKRSDLGGANKKEVSKFLRSLITASGAPSTSH